MAYKAKTQQGGYDQFQNKALPHIQAIGRFWGITLAADKEWEYHGHNEYGKHNERDKIIFGDMGIEKVLEKRGAAIPTLMKPKKAIIDRIVNDTKAPLNFERSYEEVEKTHKIDESSSLVGWSLEIAQTNKVEASGEVAGIGGSVSSETSIKAETHGEISEHTVTETEDQIKNSVKVQGEIPPEITYYVDQQFDKGTIEVPIVHDIVIDLKFEIDDWKELDKKKDKGLWGSSRRKSLRHSKTYSLLVVESAKDFLELVTGVHPDYPRQRTNHLVENTPISKHIKWLLNPKNRAIHVDLKEKYENSTSGHTRVVDHDDNEIVQAVGDEEL